MSCLHCIVVAHDLDGAVEGSGVEVVCIWVGGFGMTRPSRLLFAPFRSRLVASVVVVAVPARMQGVGWLY